MAPAKSSGLPPARPSQDRDFQVEMACCPCRVVIVCYYLYSVLFAHPMGAVWTTATPNAWSAAPGPVRVGLAISHVGLRGSGRGERLVELLDPVPHRSGGAALQVRDAADVGADDHARLQLIQVLEFAVAQLVGKLWVKH